jgi:hypothetical protein
MFFLLLSTLRVKSIPPPWILGSIKAGNLKICMHIVLDECRSAAQPALQWHEVKESYNVCCRSPL